MSGFRRIYTAGGVVSVTQQSFRKDYTSVGQAIGVGGGSSTNLFVLKGCVCVGCGG